MQFHNFAENLLGSRVKIKLVRQLLLEEAITSERDLAKLLGISHTAVSKTLKELHEFNLVSPMRVGSVIIWQLNKDSYSYQFLSGSFKEGIKTIPLSDLKKDIESELSFSYVKKVIIFGSVAEGREIPNSDIDLFILVGNEKDKKKMLPPLSDLSTYIINKFGNALSPHIFTPKDLMNTKNKKLLENVNEGIIVLEK